MKKCPRCGKKLNDNDIFCNSCGYYYQENLICPICKEPFKIGQTRCKKCKIFLPNTKIKIPKEIKKFNWSALLLTFPWCIGNNLLAILFVLLIPLIGIILTCFIIPPIGLNILAFLIFMPCVFIVSCLITILIFVLCGVYFGFKGNEISWKKGKLSEEQWESVEEFNNYQAKWDKVTLIVYITCAVLIFAINTVTKWIF